MPIADVIETPRVAVVIPLYGQAHFVTETVGSLFASTYRDFVAIVVNDGDPDPASHLAGTALQAAFGEQLVYFRQANRGLSGARNTGVNYAMARWPSVEAFFFLDSDNRVTRDTLGRLVEQLDRHPDVDLVVPHMHLFGDKQHVWRLVPELSAYRQLLENQADAAGLVRRRVFESGMYYDESMRHGYEDWEFYIRLLSAGLRALSADCLFEYRSRAGSLLSTAESMHDSIRAHMHRQNASSYEPRGMTTLEHRGVPRFSMIDEFGQVEQITDPEAGQHSVPCLGHRTPYLVLMPRSVRWTLTDAGLLRGILWNAQLDAVDHQCVVITLATGPKLQVQALTERSGDSVAGVLLPLLVTAPPAAHLDDRLARAVEIRITLPPEFVSGDLRWNDSDAIRLVERFMVQDLALPAPGARAHNEGASVTHERFTAWRHRSPETSTFPLCTAADLTDIGFIMPWVKLGGVEHCVMELARALRRSGRPLRLHLAVTAGAELEDSATVTQLFDSVTSFADGDYDSRVARCERLMASLDLTVNANSEIAYSAARARTRLPKELRTGRQACYLHMLDPQDDGTSGGWVDVAARQDFAMDRYFVISNQLRTALVNRGVAASKIVVGRNAPVVRPDDRTTAQRMAQSKADRLANGSPLRILIAGRLDKQKGGMRVASLAREFQRSGVDYHLTILGTPTLDAELPDLPVELTTWHPATHDRSRLREIFAHTDMLLLLSRWEGVPLGMLDAMAHGCLVAATNVGALHEVLVNEVNGLLLDHLGTDDEVGEAAGCRIAQHLAADRASLGIRRAAVDTAFELSWDRTADDLFALAPSPSH